MRLAAAMLMASLGAARIVWLLGPRRRVGPAAAEQKIEVCGAGAEQVVNELACGEDSRVHGGAAPRRVA